MLAFISFGIKIILASFIGGAFNYIPGKLEKNQNMIFTALICILSTTIMSITKQLSYGGDYYLMGFGILSALLVTLYVSKKLIFIEKIIWVFSCVVGIIIGVGYFLQAIILAILIYYIIHNTEDVMDFVYKSGDISSDSSNLDSENN